MFRGSLLQLATRPQRLLRAFPRGDISEEDANLSQFRRFEWKSEHFIPARQGICLGLKPRGLACESDTTVNIKPMLLMLRDKFANRFSNRVRQPGLLLEGAIHIEKPIVRRIATLIENHLDDAEPFLDRIEQRAVTLFTEPQGIFSVFLPSHVAQDFGKSCR